MDDELRSLERRILQGDIERLPEYIGAQERTGKGHRIYLVVSSSFDYNDEVYSETDGGEPVRAFLNEEAAKQELMRLGVAWLRGSCHELYEWNLDRDYEELFEDVENLGEFLTTHGAEDISDEGFSLSNATYEQIEIIFSKINLEIYYIREIVLEDGLCMPDNVMRFCAEHRASTRVAESVEEIQDEELDNEELGDENDD